MHELFCPRPDLSIEAAVSSDFHERYASGSVTLETIGRAVQDDLRAIPLRHAIYRYRPIGKIMLVGRVMQGPEGLKLTEKV